ncbi:MAG: hypothetical protein JWM34_2971 [Ilumatobacteraceae bacterium]|nr:hypothetical protein [Ilumatobacteraceae bacterium]
MPAGAQTSRIDVSVRNSVGDIASAIVVEITAPSFSESIASYPAQFLDLPLLQSATATYSF